MTGPPEPPGIDATGEARSAIADLVSAGGPVMFFQSGGCCDGSLRCAFARVSSSSAITMFCLERSATVRFTSIIDSTRYGRNPADV